LHEVTTRARGDCLIVDPWNAIGAAQVFCYASEAIALLGLAGAPATHDPGAGE